MNVSGTNISATGHKGGLGDGLYDKAGARPDLDLDFARTKSLKDRVSKEDLITFTRSTTASGSHTGATYVDEKGYINRAGSNLIKYSQDLSQSDWVKNNNTSFTGNNVVAPDGTLTAGTFSINATGYGINAGGTNATIIDPSSTSISSSVPLGGSFANLAFPSDGSWIRGRTYPFTVPSTANNSLVVFPLVGSGSIYQIVPVINGESYVYSAWIKKDPSTGKIYTWGVQLEPASNYPADSATSSVYGPDGALSHKFLSEYVKTTTQPNSAPRFTHDPETLESKGLLIERAATNIIGENKFINLNTSTSSNQFVVSGNNSTAQANGTGADGVLSPIGTTKNVAKIFLNGTEHSNSSIALGTSNTTFANSEIHTSSVFVKPSAITEWRMVAHSGYAHANEPGTGDNDGTNGDFMLADFDLTGSGSVAGSNSSLLGTSIKKYSNNWYRLSVTYYRRSNAFTNGSHAVLLYPLNPAQGQTWLTLDNLISLNSNYTLAGIQASPVTLGYIFGPQAEEGNAATSYIPTSGSEVTRSADLVKIDGDNNFGTYRKNITNSTNHLGFYASSSPRWLYGNTGAAFNLDSYSYENPIDGKHNAALISSTLIPTTENRLKFDNGSTIGPANNHVFSVYVKAVSNPCRIQFFTNVNTNERVVFNLITNNVFKGNTNDSAEIQNVGTDGWKRLIWQPSDTGNFQAWNIHTRCSTDNEARNGGSGGGSGTNEFYIYGPQLEEANDVTPYIPSTDTFTNRQSNARFVDSNGIVRRSIKNFISRSHDIDHTNSSWTRQQMGGGSVTKDANLYTAPNGLLEASKYTFTIPAGGATNDRNQLQGITSGLVQNDVVCASVYMKSAVVGQTQKINISISGTSRNVCTVTDEWQRFEIRAKRPDNSYIFRIGIRNGTSNQFTNKVNPDNTYDADTSSVYIWGAQIEKTEEDPASVSNITGTDSDPDAGLITGLASELFKTTGTATGPARYSYDPETLTPTGLYLEPAATNLLPYSEDYSKSEWEKDAVSLDSNTTATTAPDGTNTATLLTATGSTNTNHRIREHAFSLNANPYTFSAFIKFNTSNHVLFSIFKNGQTDGGASTNNIIYKKAKLNSDGSFTITGGTGTLIYEKYPNGWYRFLVTSGSSIGTQNGSIKISVLKDDSSSEPYVANGESLYVWGAQIENTNFGTSYIKTIGQANGVTRSADIFNTTATEVLDRANGTKPAFYTKSGISIFVNAQFNHAYDGESHRFNNLVNFNTHDFRLEVAGAESEKVRMRHNLDGAGTTADITGNAAPSNGFDNTKLFKAASRHKASDSILAVNGGLGSQATGNSALRSSTILAIGQKADGSRPLDGTINRIVIWKTPFVDSKLEKITQIIT